MRAKLLLFEWVHNILYWYSRISSICKQISLQLLSVIVFSFIMEFTPQNYNIREYRISSLFSYHWLYITWVFHIKYYFGQKKVRGTFKFKSNIDLGKIVLFVFPSAISFKSLKLETFCKAYANFLNMIYPCLKANITLKTGHFAPWNVIKIWGIIFNI